MLLLLLDGDGNWRATGSRCAAVECVAVAVAGAAYIYIQLHECLHKISENLLLDLDLP